MKIILVLLILCCVIALPALGELTDADLDEIRLIVNESEKRIRAEIKTEIQASETRMKEYIDKQFEGVDKQFEGVDKRITDARNLGYALIGLMAVVIGVPAWRSRKDRTLEKQIEVLTEEVEALKQQRIVSP